MADPVINEPEKVCSRCSTSKPENTEFFSPKRSGLNTRCKACVAEVGRLRWADPAYHAEAIRVRRIRYAEPPFQAKEARRQQQRNADPAHRAREAERQKRRAADLVHQQKETERNRRRRSSEAYRAKIRSYSKKWYAANAVKHAVTSKSQYDRNRDHIRAKRAEPSARERTNNWTRAHLRKHPHLKVQRSVGTAISEILKEGRVSGAFRHLPYKRADLRAHLERQFLRGMTWDNYGEVWHVDHILPQASFKINPTDPANCPEFQACWSLPNLRPLWKHDNQVKSAKRTLLL